MLQDQKLGDFRRLKFKKVGVKVNEVIGFIEMRLILQISKLLIVGVKVVVERFGLKSGGSKIVGEIQWKRRIKEEN